MLMRPSSRSSKARISLQPTIRCLTIQKRLPPTSSAARLGRIRVATRSSARLRPRGDADAERVEVAAAEGDLGQMKLRHDVDLPRESSREINEFERAASAEKADSSLSPVTAVIARGTLPSRGAFANGTAVSRTELELPPSTARTLKGPRRLVRRSARRGPSPRWQFLRGFLKNPVMVGSIIPSSRVLIEKMLGRVDWENTKLFVEYGPGVGTFTRPILEKLGPDATLVTIDTNADFTRYLRESIEDPRLVPVTGSAADVEKILADRGLPKADFVLSGLPFSTLPPGVGDAIAEGDVSGGPPGRRLPRLPVQPEGARLHQAALRQDRSRFRMDQRPAGDAVLGLEDRTAKCATSAR